MQNNNTQSLTHETLRVSIDAQLAKRSPDRSTKVAQTSQSSPLSSPKEGTPASNGAPLYQRVDVVLDGQQQTLLMPMSMVRPTAVPETSAMSRTLPATIGQKMANGNTGMVQMVPMKVNGPPVPLQATSMIQAPTTTQKDPVATSGQSLSMVPTGPVRSSVIQKPPNLNATKVMPTSPVRPMQTLSVVPTAAVNRQSVFPEATPLGQPASVVWSTAVSTPMMQQAKTLSVMPMNALTQQTTATNVTLVPVHSVGHAVLKQMTPTSQTANLVTPAQQGQIATQTMFPMGPKNAMTHSESPGSEPLCLAQESRMTKPASATSPKVAPDNILSKTNMNTLTHSEQNVKLSPKRVTSVRPLLPKPGDYDTNKIKYDGIQKKRRRGRGAYAAADDETDPSRKSKRRQRAFSPVNKYKMMNGSRMRKNKIGAPITDDQDQVLKPKSSGHLTSSENGVNGGTATSPVRAHRRGRKRKSKCPQKVTKQDSSSSRFAPIGDDDCKKVKVEGACGKITDGVVALENDGTIGVGDITVQRACDSPFLKIQSVYSLSEVDTNENGIKVDAELAKDMSVVEGVDLGEEIKKGSTENEKENHTQNGEPKPDATKERKSRSLFSALSDLAEIDADDSPRPGDEYIPKSTDHCETSPPSSAKTSSVVGEPKVALQNPTSDIAPGDVEKSNVPKIPAPKEDTSVGVGGDKLARMPECNKSEDTGSDIAANKQMNVSEPLVKAKNSDIAACAAGLKNVLKGVSFESIQQAPKDKCRLKEDTAEKTELIPKPISATKEEVGGNAMRGKKGKGRSLADIVKSLTSSAELVNDNEKDTKPIADNHDMDKEQLPAIESKSCPENTVPEADPAPLPETTDAELMTNDSMPLPETSVAEAVENRTLDDGVKGETASNEPCKDVVNGAVEIAASVPEHTPTIDDVVCKRTDPVESSASENTCVEGNINKDTETSVQDLASGVYDGTTDEQAESSDESDSSGSSIAPEDFQILQHAFSSYVALDDIDIVLRGARRVNISDLPSNPAFDPNTLDGLRLGDNRGGSLADSRRKKDIQEWIENAKAAEKPNDFESPPDTPLPPELELATTDSESNVFLHESDGPPKIDLVQKDFKTVAKRTARKSCSEGIGRNRVEKDLKKEGNENEIESWKNKLSLSSDDEWIENALKHRKTLSEEDRKRLNMLRMRKYRERKRLESLLETDVSGSPKADVDDSDVKNTKEKVKSAGRSKAANERVVKSVSVVDNLTYDNIAKSEVMSSPVVGKGGQVPAPKRKRLIKEEKRDRIFKEVSAEPDVPGNAEEVQKPKRKKKAKGGKRPSIAKDEVNGKPDVAGDSKEAQMPETKKMTKEEERPSIVKDEVSDEPDVPGNDDEAPKPKRQRMTVEEKRYDNMMRAREWRLKQKMLKQQQVDLEGTMTTKQPDEGVAAGDVGQNDVMDDPDLTGKDDEQTKDDVQAGGQGQTVRSRGGRRKQSGKRAVSKKLRLSLSKARAQKKTKRGRLGQTGIKNIRKLTKTIAKGHSNNAVENNGTNLMDNTASSSDIFTFRSDSSVEDEAISGNFREFVRGVTKPSDVNGGGGEQDVGKGRVMKKRKRKSRAVFTKFSKYGRKRKLTKKVIAIKGQTDQDTKTENSESLQGLAGPQGKSSKSDIKTDTIPAMNTPVPPLNRPRSRLQLIGSNQSTPAAALGKPVDSASEESIGLSPIARQGQAGLKMEIPDESKREPFDMNSNIVLAEGNKLPTVDTSTQEQEVLQPKRKGAGRRKQKGSVHLRKQEPAKLGEEKALHVQAPEQPIKPGQVQEQASEEPEKQEKPPPRRGRGRPRKDPLVDTNQPLVNLNASSSAGQGILEETASAGRCVQKRRGKKRKREQTPVKECTDASSRQDKSADLVGESKSSPSVDENEQWGKELTVDTSFEDEPSQNYDMTMNESDDFYLSLNAGSPPLSPVQQRRARGRPPKRRKLDDSTAEPKTETASNPALAVPSSPVLTPEDHAYKLKVLMDKLKYQREELDKLRASKSNTDA